MKAIEARTLITVVMGVVGAILLVLVFTVELPENNQQLASVVAGGFMGSFITSIGYWFNTSKSSADKNQLIGVK